MDRAAFDLVDSATVVLQTSSLKTICITFNRCFLVLTAHPFAQFLSIVFEIVVDPSQFPAQKELLSFLYFGELWGQLGSESATDAIAYKAGVKRRPLQFNRLDDAHLLKREFQRSVALASRKSKRERVTAPALVVSLNLATHRRHNRKSPGSQKRRRLPTGVKAELRLPQLIRHVV